MAWAYWNSPSELMTGIYHLKNIVFGALVGCFFYQTGPLGDHSALGKYQGNALACLYVIALAITTTHWKSYSNILGKGGTKKIYYISIAVGKCNSFVFSSLIGLSASMCGSTHCGCEIVDELPACVDGQCACECCLKAFRHMQIPSFCLLVLVECAQHAGCGSAKHPAGWFITEYSLIKGN